MKFVHQIANNLKHQTPSFTIS